MTHTSEISKWKSRVFPGRILEELSQTLLLSSRERLLLGWDAGWTRLAERDTTSFKMFKASFQCVVWNRPIQMDRVTQKQRHT